MAETKFTEQAKAWEKGDIMINGVYLTFCKMGKDISRNRKGSPSGTGNNRYQCGKCYIEEGTGF